MAGILGLRQVTRLRYGSPSYSGLDPVRPSPTTETIWASIDLAPRSEWAPDDGGQRTRRVVDVLTRTELRGADDGGQTYADRLLVDGRTYEVQTVDRLDPFEGDATEHFEVRAVEVQPLGDPAISPAAPTNITIPTIQGTIAADEVIRLYPGTWSGSQPIAYVYSLTIGGVEVATGALTAAGVLFTLPGDYVDASVILEITASNGTSPDGVAESQPVGAGGGPVDCATNCAAELAAAEAAGVVTGNTQGRAARVIQWRNPGLFSTTPTEFDPSNLGVWSAPDANGEYTITWTTGTTADGPATGTSLIWPCPMANGAQAAKAVLVGLMRVAMNQNPVVSSPLRFWAVVMDNPDPTLARGWGAGGNWISGLTRFRAGYYATTAPGVWASSYASTGDAFAAVQWAEVVSPRGRGLPSSTIISTAVRLSTGVPTSAANSTVAGTVSDGALPNPTVGLWICVGIGASTSALPSGDYRIRAGALLTDYDSADAVGVGETP